MELLVLPISGINFTAQLAIMQHLCQIDYRADVMMGSSGGNLVAYISQAADWRSNHIERIAKELKCSYFLKSWYGNGLISGAIGFFNGNAFDKGDGIEDFLKVYFNKETITKTEIWTGTYNKDLQKFRLFCNKKKEDCKLNCVVDYNITQSMEPYYCDGDIQTIAMAGIASASIPGLVPPVLFENHQYADGGNIASSPLTLLQSVFFNHDAIHITYVNAKDLSKAKLIPHHNLIDTWKQAVNDLIKSQTLIDRLVAYNLLKAKGDVVHESFECTFENLLKVKLKKQKTDWSLLEIYPTQSADMDLTNFTSEDIIRNMHTLYKVCHCNFWYVKK